MTSTPDQPDRESDRSTDEQPGADSGTKPAGPGPTGHSRRQPGDRPGDTPSDGAPAVAARTPWGGSVQPLGTETILRVAIGYIRANPGLVLGTAAVGVTLQYALKVLIPPSIDESVRGLVATLGAAALATVVFGVLYGLLLGVLGQAMVRRRVRLGEIWPAVAPRLPGLVGLTLLLGLVLGVLVVVAGALLIVAFSHADVRVLPLLGAIGAGLAVIWLGVGWSLAAPAYVFEQVGVWRALARSLRLVRGAWWRVFGFLLLASAVRLAVAVIVGVPFGGASFLNPTLSPELAPLGEQIPSMIASIIADTLTTPFVVAVTGLLYVDQLIRRAPHASARLLAPPSGSSSPVILRPRRRGPTTAALLGVVVVGAVVAGVTVFPRLVPQHTITAYSGYVGGVDIAQLDGRPVIISGGYSGDGYTYRGISASALVRDLASGAVIRALPTGDEVNDVATAQLDGRPVVIADGRVWDLATGEPIGPPLDHIADEVATAQLDGRPVIVSVADYDHTVRVWDLTTHSPIGQPSDHGEDNPGAVYTVATGQLDGRPVIISGGYDDTVRVWDLATRTPIGPPLTGHTDPVWTVTTAQLGGRAVIVSGSGDDSVRVWDLATGTPIGQPLVHEDVVEVVTAQLDGRTVIVSGGQDGTVRVWDLATGTPIGQPLGHDAAVRTVTTTQVHDRPIIISGDAEGTIRVWDPFYWG